MFGHYSPESGLDPVRIVIQPKMLDPDPDEMNADPQPRKKVMNFHVLMCWMLSFEG
jgi:hypothetical protein